jgi:CheY-like chemotaxis protein
MHRPALRENTPNVSNIDQQRTRAGNILISRTLDAPRLAGKHQGTSARVFPRYMAVPLLLPPTEEVPRKRTQVSSQPFSCIFVVDDEHAIASTLAAILRMNGFPAMFFTCPLEALNAARSEAPDLLISDVTMPDLSGIDLAIQMTAQYPKCKVLLFSGEAATMDLLQTTSEQGHNFPLLLKPAYPAEIFAEIGKLAEYSAA